MTDQAVVTRKSPGVLRARLSPPIVLLGLSALCTLVGWLAPVPLWQLGLILVSATLVSVVLVMKLAQLHDRRRDRADLAATRQVIEHDPMPIFCTNSHGVIVFQNPAATERFGARVGQPILRPLSRLVAHAAAVVFRQETALGREQCAREVIVTRRGPVRLASHRVGRGIVWRIEDSLEGSHRSGDWIGLPMMVVSPKDTVLSMNEAMRTLLGRRARALSDVFTTLPPVSGHLMTLSGETGPIDALVVVLEASDGRREIYALPEAAFPREDSVAARAFEALPVALVHIGADGGILAANLQAQTLLNLPSDTHQPLAGVVEGLGRPINDWLDDTLAQRIPNRPEVVRARLREEDCFLQITIGRIAGADGVSLLGVLHDATELKTLEQQFVQSQKMQAIGELAGGVAHDFNNLLTAITGHCDLLLLRHDQGDPEYADLAQINQNANRAASLVGQLLAFSRKQTLRPEVLDLRDSVGDLTHLLNRLVGEKVRLRLQHDPALLPIRADRRQLDQVLMNLVVNARDAMPDGGEILLETKVVRLTESLLRDDAEVPPGQYVAISVADEGVGIAPEKRSRIFEPFYTTKRTGEGTGLGLSMAYGIIKQTGGYIFVDSEVGKGTCFTIYCPAHDRPEESPAPEKKSSPTEHLRSPDAPGDGVILLVEDEAPVRAFASRALRLRGYTVLEAANAEEALEKLKDATLEVDVFVTDVVMPGKDGPTWVREALKERPDVKVVFVSGYAEDAFEKTGGQVPNSVFLPKPFSLTDLTTTVQRQLH